MLHDEGSNASPARGLFLTETEIRQLLETIEADEALVEQDHGVGSRRSFLKDWPLYLRLRAEFPLVQRIEDVVPPSPVRNDPLRSAWRDSFCVCAAVGDHDMPSSDHGPSLLCLNLHVSLIDKDYDKRKSRRVNEPR
jgi:hypothetical protein